MLKFISPDWLLKYGPRRLKNIGTAYRELKVDGYHSSTQIETRNEIVAQDYMMEMIQSRQKIGTKQERYDLFHNLLCANDEDAEITLDNNELLGALLLLNTN